MLCPASAQLSSNRLARGRVRACASAAARSAASEFKVSGVRLRTRGPEVARFRSRPLSPQKLERWETHSGAYRVGGGVMEIRHEDEARSRSPTLSSSWDASCGSLARSLRLRRAGVDARDLDCDELLAPPAPGQDVVVLERRAHGPEEQPCFLYVCCEPEGGEEMVAVGVVSSARNMEVYQGQEYCGTGRGRAVGAVPGHSEHEKIILYQKHLKLESSTRSCKIKLLSFGDRPCVCISSVGVLLRSVVPETSPGAPPLGSKIDLERVQAIMATMGSKLSPGAQQLMNMVKFQQQNFLPVGEQLRAALGNAALHKRVPDLQPRAAPGASDKASCTPFPFRTGLASAHVTEEPAASPRVEPAGPQHPALLEDGPTKAASSLPAKTASVHANGPGPDLLPFLQDLCSQVSHLRVGPKARWQEPLPRAQDVPAGLPMEEQPVCAHLVKILLKNLGLLEQQLRAHIDKRVLRLQEHLDAKLTALVASLRSPACSPAAGPLTRWDSGEKLSNGER